MTIDLQDAKPVGPATVSLPEVAVTDRRDRTDQLSRFRIVARAVRARPQPFQSAGQGGLDDE